MFKYWRRFIWRNTEDRFPFWLYLMLLATLAYGISFTFFGASASVQASVLYQLTTDIALVPAVSLWGLAAIGAVLMTILNLIARYRPISAVGPTLGYLVWFYAFVVYLGHGYVMQSISAFIWIVFWAAHHFRLYEYRQNVDAGIETPPE